MILGYLFACTRNKLGWKELWLERNARECNETPVWNYAKRQLDGNLGSSELPKYREVFMDYAESSFKYNLIYL